MNGSGRDSSRLDSHFYFISLYSMVYTLWTSLASLLWKLVPLVTGVARRDQHANPFAQPEAL